MDKKANKGGRGNKAITPKRAYRLAIDVGELAKKISDKYEYLSEMSPNDATRLLSAIELAIGSDVISEQ